MYMNYKIVSVCIFLIVLMVSIAIYKSNTEPFLIKKVSPNWDIPVDIVTDTTNNLTDFDLATPPPVVSDSVVSATPAIMEATEANIHPVNMAYLIRLASLSPPETKENTSSKTQEWIDRQNAKNEELIAKRIELTNKIAELSTKTTELNNANTQLTSKTNELNNANTQLTSKTNALNNANTQLTGKTNALNNANTQLTSKTNELNTANNQITTLRARPSLKKDELILSGSGLAYPNSTKGSWEKKCTMYNNKPMWHRNGWHIYRVADGRWFIASSSPTNHPAIVNLSQTSAEWPWTVGVNKWNNPDIQISGSVSLPINC